jgi:Flp pilus assembly pilin Flp
MHSREVILIGVIKRLVRDNAGGTSIEYGLIAAAMGVAIITTVYAISGSLNVIFTTALVDLTAAAK